MLSTTYRTFCKVLSAKTASDCSLSFADHLRTWVFPTLLGWTNWSQQKITFDCSFIVQNPFQAFLGLWKTLKNFRKIFWSFLFISTPIIIGEKKWSQQKISFECSFIVQNPFQTVLGLWKVFEIFENFRLLVSYIRFFYVFTKKI